MFKLGETVRLTANIMTEDRSAWMHAGELVKLTGVSPASHPDSPPCYRVETADGRTGTALRCNVREDQTLPLFDAYRPETTGCLF